jgi:hypothetical protein
MGGEWDLGSLSQPRNDTAKLAGTGRLGDQAGALGGGWGVDVTTKQVTPGETTF